MQRGHTARQALELVRKQAPTVYAAWVQVTGGGNDMETTMDRRAGQTMEAGVAAAWGLRGAAVAARRAHEDAQSAERAKLSVKGWVEGLLAQAGHDEARVREVDARMGSVPHLFGNAAAYRHQVARVLADGYWWAPGPSTPMVAADRALAQMEVQQIPGANLFTLCALAVADAERMTPAAFGEHDDLEHHRRARAQVVDRAAAALEAVRAIPDVLLLGMAASRDVSLDPRGSLPERLVAATMAEPAAPRSVAPRSSDGAVVAAR